VGQTLNFEMQSVVHDEIYQTEYYLKMFDLCCDESDKDDAHTSIFCEIRLTATLLEVEQNHPLYQAVEQFISSNFNNPHWVKRRAIAFILSRANVPDRMRMVTKTFI
jgi:hypothetical protein